MKPLITISNLTRKFGKKIAVNNVSLNIQKGEIFGILGPNGAGKTTIISMLTTIRFPTSGRITVDKQDIIKNSKEVRKMIGVVFQDFLLDEDLTAFANLEIHAMLYKLNKKQRIKRIKEVLKIVDLEKEQNNKVKNFSGGMKRRLEIARGLLSQPKILLLDEPTLGLDPIAKNNLWKYIRMINKNSKTTIILTTNNMDEAEKLCDRVAILYQGKLIRVDSVKQIKKVHKNKNMKTLEDAFIYLTKKHIKQ